jgi:small subunit ribosomal protein S8
MSVDTIANMLSQMKNAMMSSRESVEFPHSRMREEILKVMKDTGFIKEAKVFKDSNAPHKSLHVDFMFDEEGRPLIRDLKRVSKPGKRVYSTSSRIKKVNQKYGLVIVSTSAGIMSSAAARKRKLGGEVICEIL